MSAPIIFLDFDGVITSIRTRYDYLDQVAVRMVEDLCLKSGAVLCISSTWRMGATQGDIATLLKQAGMRNPKFHECWATPVLHTERGHEIKVVLDKYSTEKYLILDDDSDFLDEQKPFHVKTDALNGFLWEHYEKAHEVLGVNIV